MWAQQAFVVPGLCRISQTLENMREEALFGIARAGLAQVFAHFSFANLNWLGHG